MRTFTFATLSTVFAVSTAQAQTDCEVVRRARVLAAQSGLDGDNLAQLELHACAARIVEAPVGGDCRALRVMSVLARIDGTDAGSRSQIESARVVACRGAPERSITRWPNGRVARTSHDTWYYPNGVIAARGESWFYPSRVLAVSGDTLYYPNRVVARSSNGAWFSASREHLGGDGEAGTWACDRLGSDPCADALRLVPFLTELARRAQFLELLWAAS